MIPSEICSVNILEIKIIVVATDELLTYYLIQNGTWDTNMQLTNNSVRKK